MTDLQRGLLFVRGTAAGSAELPGGRPLPQEPDQVASIVLLGNIAAVVFVPIGLYPGLK
jgi:hypothetical protein